MKVSALQKADTELFSGIVTFINEMSWSHTYCWWWEERKHK